MATKWSYEFFTDTTNAMSIEERIKETVANMSNGKIVFPDGECCSTEEELRSLLLKKHILEDTSKSSWIGSKITLAILFFVMLFFGACGSKGSSTDAEVRQLKVWNYGNISGGYQASLHSTNYYSTDKDENLYLNITLRNSGYGVIGGFDWYVYGTPQNEAATAMKFLPNVDHVIITFDNGEGEIWRGVPSKSGLTFQIVLIDDFIERLKTSNSCSVFLEAAMGQVTYNFDTKNLKWN